MKKPPKLAPNTMRNIFYKNGGEGTYATFTQIATGNFKEWPPGEHSIVMFYKHSIIVGTSAVDKVALDNWRRKYSVYAVPKMPYSEEYTQPKLNRYDDEFIEMYKRGMRQSDIAKQLGVSPAYVSLIKKRLKNNVDRPLI